MADVSALDLGGGRDACHAGGGGTALFLDDNDNAITWFGERLRVLERGALKGELFERLAEAR